VYKICRESFNGGIFGRPTTAGKAIFIDLIDVGCDWIQVAKGRVCYEHGS